MTYSVDIEPVHNSVLGIRTAEKQER